MENGINHEGEEGEGDLAGEEPKECHSYIKNHWYQCTAVVGWQVMQYSPRY